jgi:hypothetical protein
MEQQILSLQAKHIMILQSILKESPILPIDLTLTPDRMQPVP